MKRKDDIATICKLGSEESDRIRAMRDTSYLWMLDEGSPEADLDSLEKRVVALEKRAKGADKEAKAPPPKTKPGLSLAALGTPPTAPPTPAAPPSPPEPPTAPPLPRRSLGSMRRSRLRRAGVGLPEGAASFGT